MLTPGNLWEWYEICFGKTFTRLFLIWIPGPFSNSRDWEGPSYLLEVFWHHGKVDNTISDWVRFEPKYSAPQMVPCTASTSACYNKIFIITFSFGPNLNDRNNIRPPKKLLFVGNWNGKLFLKKFFALLWVDFLSFTLQAMITNYPPKALKKHL